MESNPFIDFAVSFLVCIILTMLFIIYIKTRVVFTKRPLVLPSDILAQVILVAIFFICVMRVFIHFFLPEACQIYLIYLPSNIAISSLIIISSLIMSRNKVGKNYVGNNSEPNSYSIFGIENSAFCESLVAVLNQSNTPFHEDMTGISIPNQNIQLPTNFSLVAALVKSKTPFHEDMTGISIPNQNIKIIANFSNQFAGIRIQVIHIQVQDALHTKWLKNLVDDLKKHYASNPVNITMDFRVLNLNLIMMLMFLLLLLITELII